MVLLRNNHRFSGGLCSEIATINELIQNANTAITENNRLVDNFTNERNQLVKHIWNYFAHSYSAAIEAHNKKLIGINKAIKNLQTKRTDARQDYKTAQPTLLRNT